MQEPFRMGPFQSQQNPLKFFKISNLLNAYIIKNPLKFKISNLIINPKSKKSEIHEKITP